MKERAFDKDQLGRITHYSEIQAETDHFYGFGEKTGHLDKKGRHLRMSPKDAIGATRNSVNRCTNMFRSISVSMRPICMHWDCFTTILMTLYLIWEMSAAATGTAIVIIRRTAGHRSVSDQRTGDGFGIGALYLSDGTSGNADETSHLGYTASTIRIMRNWNRTAMKEIYKSDPETF